MESIHALTLKRLVEVSPPSLWEYVKWEEGPGECLHRISALPGVSRTMLKRCRAWAEEILEKAVRKQLRILYPGDGLCPHDFLFVKPPIIVLFARGEVDVLKNPAIAVVGTRKPTRYGLRVVGHFSRFFAATGITLVSGMALGIDAAAHETTMDEGGFTIAVLGSGADMPYPRSNERIYRKIVEGKGCVVSEFPPGTTPRPYHFPLRNRVIAALARGVVVVEAPLGSGALITARHAADLGREVFAVTGSVFSSRSEGCHKLLEEGAAPALSPERIVEALFPGLHSFEAGNDATALTPEEMRVIESLNDSGLHVDELAELLGKSVNEMLVLLTEMELRGLIVTSGAYVYPGGRRS